MIRYTIFMGDLAFDYGTWLEQRKIRARVYCCANWSSSDGFRGALIRWRQFSCRDIISKYVIPLLWRHESTRHALTYDVIDKHAHPVLIASQNLQDRCSQHWAVLFGADLSKLSVHFNKTSLSIERGFLKSEQAIAVAHLGVHSDCTLSH